jgi:acetyltransferase-like isoleucine patch superfamily enzyme
MRTFLRRLYYALIRAHDAFVGPELATARRLIKAGRLTIGPHTLGYSLPRIKTYIHDDTRLHIGDYSSLPPDATVMLGGRHPSNAVTTYPHRILWGMEGAGEDGFPEHSPDSSIGSDVWLGDKVLVLTGVRIGDGAIIAANSLVNKDIPDYAIAGGVPAKVIRYRFPEEQRRALLEIAWWDWPEDEVRKAVPLIASKDIDAFIEYARERQRAGAVPQPRTVSTDLAD